MRKIQTPLCCRCAGILKTAGMKITRLRDAAEAGSVCPWCEHAGSFLFHIIERSE